MSRDFSKCTNDGDYELRWLDEESSYFFSTSVECCMRVFNYEGCRVEDVCAKSIVPKTAPAPNPPAPVHSPATQAVSQAQPPTTLHPLATSTAISSLDTRGCGANKNKKQCAKDDMCRWGNNSCVDAVFASADGEPTIESAVPLTESSPGTNNSINCQVLSRRQCFKSANCKWGANSCVKAQQQMQQSAASQGGCSGSLYHPSSVYERVCTNDGAHPSSWKDDVDRYFFSTGHDCCNAFYNDGPCEVIDTCTPNLGSEPAVKDVSTLSFRENCEGRRWHPTSNESERTCTNSLHDYPLAWDAEPNKFFSRNAKKCCRKFYPGGCNTVDVCSR